MIHLRGSILSVAASVALLACETADTNTPSGGTSTGSGGAEAQGGGGSSAVSTFTVPNVGNPELEGHTPRGFQGMGTGLFAGDNLNPNFPEGDGVQLFLTFDLAAMSVPPGTVTRAELRTTHADVSGQPYATLGSLRAAEMRFDAFSSSLWDQAPEPAGVDCEFASSEAGPFACDFAAAVQRSIDEGRPYVQVRIRFDEPGDGDGQQDLALFFITDSNTNEPGIFELVVDVSPE